MEPPTAGDPIPGLKWTRKTTQKISRELRKAGFRVGRTTVGRLLQTMHYSLRVNHKKLSRVGASGAHRNRQFQYIADLRQSFDRDGLPLVSIDTKKKELVGRFKNAGAVWATRPTLVNDHDFRSDAAGMAIPFGIYDPPANRGHVFVGPSHDTPAFAVRALRGWWTGEGRHRYPDAMHLLILADGGGSNGPRCHAWKYDLQTNFCDRFQIAATGCHYPPGTSKWNPIEHRLFSEISKNGAGEPLDSYETILTFIRTTKTETGLVVRATLLKGDYPTGAKISAAHMGKVSLLPHKVLPQWNYTLLPTPARM